MFHPVASEPNIVRAKRKHCANRMVGRLSLVYVRNPQEGPRLSILMYCIVRGKVRVAISRVEIDCSYRPYICVVYDRNVIQQAASGIPAECICLECKVAGSGIWARRTMWAYKITAETARDEQPH